MMKNRLQTGGRTVPGPVLLVLLLILLVLLLIPLFFLSHYAVPAADDFSFSCETHAAVKSGGGLFAILAGALSKTKEVYTSWQGSFSAVFLMTLQPSVWGFRFYRLTTYIMVIPLIASLFFFCLRMFSGIFHAEKSLSGSIAAIAAIACTQFLPSPNQAFYWFNGAVYYTFAFALMLTLIACLIGYYLYGGRGRLAVSCVLAFIIGGNNYVTALLSVILLFCTVVFLLLFRKQSRKPLLLPFFFLLAAFLMNTLAPGNAVRQAFFTDHPGPFEAVLLSFRYAAQHSLKWFDFRLLACVFALLPFLWKAAAEARNNVFSFPVPVFVSVFSFCLLSSMFTPHVYAIGFDGPGRIQDIYFDAFVLLLILNLFWWIGWMSGKLTGKMDSLHGGIGLTTLVSCWGMALVCLLCSVVFFHGSLTSVAAVGELRTGEAKDYYAEALERQVVLEDPAVEDCVFRPFENMPYLLFFADMTDDPASYENEDTATFYGKKSIVVKPA